MSEKEFRLIVQRIILSNMHELRKSAQDLHKTISKVNTTTNRLKLNFKKREKLRRLNTENQK